MEHDNSNYIRGCFWELEEIMYIRLLSPFLAQGKHTLNGIYPKNNLFSSVSLWLFYLKPIVRPDLVVFPIFLKSSLPPKSPAPKGWQTMLMWMKISQRFRGRGRVTMAIITTATTKFYWFSVCLRHGVEYFPWMISFHSIHTATLSQRSLDIFISLYSLFPLEKELLSEDFFLLPSFCQGTEIPSIVPSNSVFPSSLTTHSVKPRWDSWTEPYLFFPESQCPGMPRSIPQCLPVGSRSNGPRHATLLGRGSRFQSCSPFYLLCLIAEPDT